MSAIEGNIYFDNRQPAAKIELFVYQKEFGEEKLLGTVKTNAEGKYKWNYELSDKPLTIEIKVKGQGDDDGFVAISRTLEMVKSAKPLNLNLVAPLSIISTGTEFSRLNKEIKPFLGNKTLAEAKEIEGQRDLSLLYNKTGWDARILALGATAEKLQETTGIPKEGLYGMLRSGLPSNPSAMALLQPEAVTKALKKAKANKLINVNVDAVVKKFKKFKKQNVSKLALPGGTNTVNDFVKSSGLNPTQQKKFVKAYVEDNLRGEKLWSVLAEGSFQDALAVEKLKHQGKMAFLTQNNDSLIRSVNGDIASSTSNLIKKKFHRPETWQLKIKALSGNDEDKLKKLIPENYSGETVAERLENYASDLSRKVRLSYPTQILSAMVRDQDIKIEDKQGQSLNASVNKLINNALKVDNNFVMGDRQLLPFIDKNKSQLLQGIAVSKQEAAIEEFKSLGRLYQTTLDDKTLKICYEQGFRSARDIVAFEEEEFIRYYGHLFESEPIIRLIYNKARQISDVSYNFFGEVKNLNNSISMAALSPSVAEKKEVADRLIKQYPTLENLFGSLDYCECEHCRSVLSPAAYLVDLFKFLDREESVWTNFIEDWNSNSEDFKPFNKFFKRPYQALIDRRPDLPSLELTCENTNTVLPYIDVVNEIFEFYLAKDKLDASAAINTEKGTLSEDLLAEPQNIIPEAYEKLNSAKYPLTLPFDLWLETTRKFSEHFDYPFWKILEMFKTTDGLFINNAQPTPYALNEIFYEYLNLSKNEYDILTKDGITNWNKLYGYDLSQNALKELKFAKTLSRRLDVTYKELSRLVQTQFLNPNLTSLVTLRKLNITTQDVFSYMEDPNYPSLTHQERDTIHDRLKEYQLIDESDNSNNWISKTWNSGGFDNILVLFDVDSGCSFDNTLFRYANGNAAKRLDFLKLNYFVRLWKKLNISIEELDAILVALTPNDVFPYTEATFNKTLKTIIIYLAHLMQLDDALSLRKNSKLQLLSLWRDMDVLNNNTLYESYFLNPVVLREDPIFDNSLGHYLKFNKNGQFLPFAWDKTKAENPEEGNVSLLAHINTVQSAFGLTYDDIEHVFSSLNKSLEDQPLNHETLGLIQRYAVLSKGLKIDIDELTSLIELTGRDPFKLLSPKNITKIKDDHPYTNTLAFVELVQKVKESPFSIEAINYLIRHQYDVNGKLNTDLNTILNLARSLKSQINQIQLLNQIPEDPNTYSEEQLTQAINSVFNSEIGQTFQEMWLGKKEWSVSKSSVAIADKIGDGVFDKNIDGLQAIYNEITGEQSIVFTGVLTKAKYDSLITKFIDPNPAILSDDQKSLLVSLLDQALHFFKDYIAFIYPDSVNIQQEYAKVFDAQSENRKTNLVPALLNHLTAKQINQLIEETVNSEFDSDQETSKYLLDKMTIKDALQEVSLKSCFTELLQHPISVVVPATNKIIYKNDSIVNLAELDGQTSSIMSGYIEVPENGNYRFFIDCKSSGTTVNLSFSHLQDPLIDNEVATNANKEFSAPLALEANIPYRFDLEVENLQDTVTFTVQGENILRGDVSRIVSFSGASLERLGRTYEKLTKSLLIIDELDLSSREIEYIESRSSTTDFGNFSFNELPTSEDEASLNVVKRYNQLQYLLNYYQLKTEINHNGDELIDVFENASKSQPETREQLSIRLANLFRRSESNMLAIMTFINQPSNHFVNAKAIRHVWDYAQMVHKFGIDIEAIAAITSIAGAALSNAERYGMVNKYKNAIKARYSVDNWRRVAPTIYDPIRQSKRDALSALIMHKNGFERPEQLFEFFLIDQGMEPVVKTSRIKLALSALQTFIQRCLLNLEGPSIAENGDVLRKGVTPKSILAKHWQWMRRYRVWEANRKIFLYPENWLEPEFRDDKTHLYEELEGALLQGDVSQDLVEKAFFNYLKQLEQISRLDMRAMHCEENPLNPASNTIHVLGRTFNVPHKYYYRTYSSGEWTPWVPVATEIEGNHITLIKWRDRMHIFWLTFIEKEEASTSTTTTYQSHSNSNINSSVKKHVEIQLNWCEYYQGEWTERQLGRLEDNILKKNVGINFDRANVYVHAMLENPNQGNGVIIAFNCQPLRGVGVASFSGSFKLQSKLSRPEEGSKNYIVKAQVYNSASIKMESRYASRIATSSALTAKWNQKMTTKDGKSTITMETKNILDKSKGRYYLLVCNSFADIYSGTNRSFEQQANSLISPFFYIDSQHTFYVQPELRETVIEKWDDWILPIPPIIIDWEIERIPIGGVFPIFPPPSINPFDPPGWEDPIPDAIIDFIEPIDWTINPGTILEFEGLPIGSNGKLDIIDSKLSDVILTDANILDTNLSEIDASSVLLVDSHTGNIVSTNINFIGSSGINSDVISNVLENNSFNSTIFRNINN